MGAKDLKITTIFGRKSQGDNMAPPGMSASWIPLPVRLQDVYSFFYLGRLGRLRSRKRRPVECINVCSLTHCADTTLPKLLGLK